MSRNINTGRVYEVLKAASDAWEMPGLAPMVKVKLVPFLRLQVRGDADKKPKNPAKICAAAAYLSTMTIKIRRSEWELYSDKQRVDTLVHELAHIAEFIKRGDSNHGKYFRDLMVRGKENVPL